MRELRAEGAEDKRSRAGPAHSVTVGRENREAPVQAGPIHSFICSFVHLFVFSFVCSSNMEHFLGNRKTVVGKGGAVPRAQV